MMKFTHTNLHSWINFFLRLFFCSRKLSSDYFLLELFRAILVHSEFHLWRLDKLPNKLLLLSIIFCSAQTSGRELFQNELVFTANISVRSNFWKWILVAPTIFGYENFQSSRKFSSSAIINFPRRNIVFSDVLDEEINLKLPPRNFVDFGKMFKEINWKLLTKNFADFEKIFEEINQKLWNFTKNFNCNHNSSSKVSHRLLKYFRSFESFEIWKWQIFI